MCFWSVPQKTADKIVEKQKPKIELLVTTSLSVETKVEELKLKKMFPTLTDMGEDYTYTKSTDWATVFDYIYFKFPMPSYLAARMDCDDFAVLLKGLVASFFGLNYFGVVFGWAPGGYHAWCIFNTENGLFCLEPQTGQYFPVGEQGYQPEWILI